MRGDTPIVTTHRLTRKRHLVRGFVALLLTTGLLAAIAPGAGAATAPPNSSMNFVFKAAEGQLPTAEAVVVYLGGTVTKHAELPGVFEGRIPVAVTPGYEGMPALSPEGKNLLSLLNSVPTVYDCVRLPTDYNLSTALSPYSSATDMYSLANTARAMGADKYTSNGFRGQGIDVAVIDTGVSAPAGPLRSKLIDGPDFSFDSPMDGLRSRDAFGHGTHMASIVNAIAPDARIVNVKVGDGAGVQDVTQLIAAIDWVREHKKSYGLNVRVISLSYGAVSLNAWTKDELSRAAQLAWEAGIVVVASGGNDGGASVKSDPGLNAPAYNKNIIAVGGYDVGTNIDTSDDSVTGFNSGASSSNKRDPDFVAPGRSIAGVRVAGSAADEQILDDVCDPQSHRWPLLDSGRYVRGSGSSQAAAAVAGGVALILSRDVVSGRNWFTSDYRTGPDFLKTMLRKSTTTVKNATLSSAAPESMVGMGALSLSKMYGASFPKSAANSHDAVEANGLLDGTRNGDVVVSPFTGQEVRGQFDVLGNAYTGQYYGTYGNMQRWFSMGGCKAWTAWYWHVYSADKPTTADCWIADPGAGFVLSPTNPYPAYKLPYAPGFGTDNPDITPWDGLRWREGTWDGLRWRDAGWDGLRWRDNGWDGLRWRDNKWDGLRWREFGWDAIRWRAAAWDGLRWREVGWADANWD